jgi:hypothetical protein
MMTGLTGTPPRLAAAAAAAQSLGYRTDNHFQAVCLPADAVESEQMDRLQSALSGLTGTAHCGANGGLIVVLGQDLPAQSLVTAVRGAAVRAPVGVGLRRPHLTGAAQSIVDATNTLRVADTHDIRWYATQWPLAELTTSLDRLPPIIGPIGAAATAHPHLADTVRAYAQAGFSVSGAARTLRLHPKTVAYRLSRWQHLTGHDPRTWTGLLPTLIALGLAASTTAPTADRTVVGHDASGVQRRSVKVGGWLASVCDDVDGDGGFVAVSVYVGSAGLVFGVRAFDHAGFRPDAAVG